MDCGSNVMLHAAISQQPILNAEQIVELSSYINNYRQMNQAPPLAWDSTIATFSQTWSNYLLANHLFQHSGTVLYGENLAYFKGYGSDMMALIKLAIDMWYNEIKLYDFNNPDFSEATGHFTALVWKNSTNYGIGFSINKYNEVDVTMNMSPPGNVIGLFAQNVLPVITIDNPVNVPSITPLPIPTIIPYNSAYTSNTSNVYHIPEHKQTHIFTSNLNNVIASNVTISAEMILLKANTIHGLYNLVNDLNTNKPRNYILNDVNTLITKIASM